MRYHLLMIMMLATILSGQNKALKWAVAGQAADLVITQAALANGAAELNPLMVSQPVFAMTKVGLSVALCLYSKRHPREKRTMTIFAVLSWLPVGYTIIKSQQ